MKFRLEWVFTATNSLLLTNKGSVSSIGSGRQGSKDGTAEEARFDRPSGISHSESDGSLFICDYNSDKIRKITFKGILQMSQFLIVNVKITWHSSSLIIKTIY